ncbi:hypothetical protein E3N88_04115 [Mikania micrantha]|uniref:BED-type domain-containing protein n=1 Tax=Mikania micrantha TaxID=192012 RepID=A0A5N6PUS4_9ASTR|nr:hypothetical protein E3N88_04115 [Mikania micrantha]
MIINSQKKGNQNLLKETEKKKAKTLESKKKGRSTVWDDFDKFTDDEGDIKAKCKHCIKILAADPSRNGTSALKRHILSCEKHPDKLKNQANIFIKKNDDVGGTSGEVKTWKFCAKATRKAVAEMIILDELPFTTVEHEGFRNLMQTTCPNFKTPSRFTVSRDVGEIYLEEKAMNHKGFDIQLFSPREAGRPDDSIVYAIIGRVCGNRQRRQVGNGMIEVEWRWIWSAVRLSM